MRKFTFKRSWWKQLTFVGRLYSVIPGQAPKLNRTERLNQNKHVQAILRRINRG